MISFTALVMIVGTVVIIILMVQLRAGQACLRERELFTNNCKYSPFYMRLYFYGLYKILSHFLVVAQKMIDISSR